MSGGETVSLRTLPAKAAALLETAGWTQGTERDDAGRVCLTGALQYCDPRPGDFHLARAVYRHWGRGENWNDEEGRTEVEVLDALHREITDQDLADTFGPNWLCVVRLVRRAAVFTVVELAQLAAARAAAWDAARAAARAAAGDAARAAAWDAARAAARAAAGDAARDATLAVVTRDLITPEQFDTLTGPWVSVLGPTWDEAVADD